MESKKKSEVNILGFLQMIEIRTYLCSEAHVDIETSR